MGWVYGPAQGEWSGPFPCCGQDGYRASAQVPQHPIDSYNI